MVWNWLIMTSRWFRSVSVGFDQFPLSFGHTSTFTQHFWSWARDMKSDGNHHYSVFDERAEKQPGHLPNHQKVVYPKTIGFRTSPLLVSLWVPPFLLMSHMTAWLWVKLTTSVLADCLACSSGTKLRAGSFACLVSPAVSIPDADAEIARWRKWSGKKQSWGQSVTH